MNTFGPESLRAVFMVPAARPRESGDRGDDENSSL